MSLGQVMKNVKPSQCHAEPPDQLGKYETDMLLQPDSEGVSDYGLLVAKVCAYIGGLKVPNTARQFYSRTGYLKDNEKLPMYDHFNGLHTVDMAPLFWRPEMSCGYFFGSLDRTLVIADYQIQVGISSVTAVSDALDSTIGKVANSSTSTLPQQLANFSLMTYMATEGLVAETYTVPPSGESISQASPHDTRYRMKMKRVKYPILYVSTDQDGDEEPSMRLRDALADHFLLPALDLEESGVYRYSLQDVPRGFNLMEIGTGQGVYPAGVNYTSVHQSSAVRKTAPTLGVKRPHR